jgi:hypothetical protein
MWESPLKPKELDSEQLDDIWSWYKDWLDLNDGKMPDLDEEDFEMITNHIKDLFGYIAYLRSEMHTLQTVEPKQPPFESIFSRRALKETVEPKQLPFESIFSRQALKETAEPKKSPFGPISRPAPKEQTVESLFGLPFGKPAPREQAVEPPKQSIFGSPFKLAPREQAVEPPKQSIFGSPFKLAPREQAVESPKQSIFGSLQEQDLPISILGTHCAEYLIRDLVGKAT